MKNILPIIVCLFTSMLFAQEKIGINTETPKRTLDIKGDMRVTKHANGYNQEFSDVLIADENGNIDKRSKPSILIHEDTQVETIRNIYYSDSGSDIQKSVKCARFEVTLSNDNIPMIRLRQPIKDNTTISYGLKRLERRINTSGSFEDTGTGDYYVKNYHVEYTPEDWNTYQPIYKTIKKATQPMINNDSYRLHVVDSETGDFYKIDFSRMVTKKVDWVDSKKRNDKNSGTRAIVCERFFNIKN